MPKFGTYLAVTFGLTLGTMAFAGESSVNDCGSSLAQVKQIIESKFSKLSPSLVNGFIGRWIYGSEAPESISMSGRLNVWKRDILVCPKENGTFEIRLAESKSVIGTLSKRNSNRLILSTAMGPYVFQREGSMTAARD